MIIGSLKQNAPVTRRTFIAGTVGTGLVMVTHDPLAAERADVVLHLDKGVLKD